MRVAIIGCGVAGPTLAYWLGRFGCETRIFENAPALRRGGYMVDFWGLGFRIAERMGLADTLRVSAYNVREVRFLDAAGHPRGAFHVDRIRRLLGDRFISLPRGELAAALQGAVAGEVETVFGAELTSIVDEAGGVSLGFADGAEHRFDLVVGADGLHSAVRRLKFGPQDRFERQLGYGVAAFEATGYRPRDELTYVSYGLPGRQISRFSMRGDRTMFLLVFAEERLPSGWPQRPSDQVAALQSMFCEAREVWPPIAAQLDATESLYFDRVSQIEMNQWSSGRVALIGDAASCVSLLAGEGSGLAMAQAYVLAGELARCGGDHAQAFHRYQRRMSGLLRDKQDGARRFAAAFAPKTALGLWFRDKVADMLDTPGVTEWFVGRELKDDFELPDYTAQPVATL